MGFLASKLNLFESKEAGRQSPPCLCPHLRSVRVSAASVLVLLHQSAVDVRTVRASPRSQDRLIWARASVLLQLREQPFPSSHAQTALSPLPWLPCGL